MPTLPKLVAVFALILLVVGLPILGHFARQKDGHHCALDGVLIEPIYRVRIVDHDQHSYEFCCIKCAQWWLASRGDKPCTVFVRDESGGKEIPSEDAHFVTSTVITMPTTGNTIHVFAEEVDAQKHADKLWGRVLKDGDRPFHQVNGG